MSNANSCSEVGEEAPFSYNQVDVKVPKKKMLWILIGTLSKWTVHSSHCLAACN